MVTLLKSLLQRRHLQTYELFRQEYRRAAEGIDSQDDAPSRTQYRRWLSGNLRGLPHPRHCRVLAAMFPECTVEELFGSADRMPSTLVSPAGHAIPRRSRGVERTESRRSDRSRGRVILDVHTDIRLDIDESGRAVVGYTYEMLNQTDRPVERIPRTIWFKHTHSEIQIAPVQVGEHQVLIEMIHESAPQKKFAYHLSPAVEVGGRAKYGCEIRGGLFADELFWRHLAIRHTNLVTLDVVHRSRTLSRCSASEELTDGSEILVSDQIEWKQDGSDIRLRLQRQDLEPPQVVTLRWESNE